MSEAAKVQESVQCFGRKVGQFGDENRRIFDQIVTDSRTRNIILMHGIITL